MKNTLLAKLLMLPALFLMLGISSISPAQASGDFCYSGWEHTEHWEADLEPYDEKDHITTVDAYACADGRHMECRSVDGGPVTCEGETWPLE